MPRSWGSLLPVKDEEHKVLGRKMIISNFRLLKGLIVFRKEKMEIKKRLDYSKAVLPPKATSQPVLMANM